MSAIPHPDEFPRQLTPREAEVLDFMLGVDDPRVAPLREQRKSVVATGVCGCGCASIDLAVDRERYEPAAICGQPISAELNPAKAAVAYPNESYGLLIFLDQGWLSLLEVSWHEKPPAEFPPANAFDPPEVTCERLEAALAEMRRGATFVALTGNDQSWLRGATRAVRRLLGRRPTT